MVNETYRRQPEVLFLSLALFLVPCCIVFCNSDWPPLRWRHTHFAEGNFGQNLLFCAGLLFVLACAYLAFPIVFQRRMNRSLARLHFVTNVIALLFQVAVPIYFNLTFRMQPGESASNSLRLAIMPTSICGTFVLDQA